MQAVLTLFGVTTLDNWTEVLFAVSDVTSINTQPILNSSPGNTIFLMVFVCVSAFWVMRVFIGIFTDQVSNNVEFVSLLPYTIQIRDPC